MASVKYGALITEIKGKVGGSVFQGARGAPMMKNIPQHAGLKQGTGVIGSRAYKAAFSAVAKRWGELTDIQRATWGDLIGVWTFLDRFGDAYNGTPYQIFCACNLNQLMLDSAFRDVAPAVLAAIDPLITWSTYSLAGAFNMTVGSAAVLDQYYFNSISMPVQGTRALSSIRFPTQMTAQNLGIGADNRKAEFAAYFTAEPELGTYFYIKSWHAWGTYPKKQFPEIAKILVVA